MRERIQQALDEIRPLLQKEGGDLELVEVKDNGRVLIRFLDGDHGRAARLKPLAVKTIRDKVPEVTEVAAVNGGAKAL